MNTENNKLIALFMSLPSFNFKGHTIFIIEDTQHLIEENLSYHTSWSMLIPVVKKIKSIYKTIPEYWQDWDDVISDALLKLDIHLLYNVASDFIRWYNQQTENEIDY